MNECIRQIVEVEGVGKLLVENGIQYPVVKEQLVEGEFEIHHSVTIYDINHPGEHRDILIT